jgi:hypothetical protein
MILFLEQWKDYPNAIIDYKTNNKSALELAVKLKQMGIKNNSFFLALHDPTLSGLDPLDPNLTQEQMIRVGIECRVNPWYVLREVARVPSQAGNASDRVQFNRSIICLWWCFFNHVTIILTQPRQTGKSFGTDLLLNGLMNFWSSNTKINLLTLSDKLRTETVGRIKAIYEELPKYLKFKTRNDLNNTEEMTINKFNNKYRTHIAQSSPKAAYNLGRGLTTPILHVDEGPFQPNINVALDACLPAMDAAIDMAAKNDEPYGIIYTTTAGKKDEASGKFFYRMIGKSARWTEKFYDCENQESLELVIRSNKGTYRVYAEFSHRQLGKTDEWLMKKIGEREMSPDAVNRDYFNIWTSGTQTSPIPTKFLEKLTNSIVNEAHQHISPIGSYITRWYIEENQREAYMKTNKTIIGVDTSDASGGDDISFVGVDVETGATVFIGTFNETNLIAFCQWLVWWLFTYENSTMIIERKSSGVTIIDYLLMFLPQKGIDPFKRLFNWVANDPLEHKERHTESQYPIHRRADDLYVRAKKYFGFATSGGGETSRSELYSTTLQNAVKRCSDRVLDKELTEQITGLVIRNGRVDHDVGGHDDLVIGWLLCHWFLTMGKNLNNYGIDPIKVLCKSQEVKQLTIEEQAVDYEQSRIRARISELFTLLANEQNSFICERYEKELRLLDSRIVLKNNEYFSVDATINTAREENKRKYKSSYQPLQQNVFNDLNYNSYYNSSDNRENIVLS